MYGKYDIKEIIFLAMSEDEFDTEETVREYLSYQLPKKQNGEYWHQVKGINLIDTEALVLFQYRGRLIGCGIFRNREKFPVPQQDGKFVYHGINHFYPESIFNIEPITGDEIKRIDISFSKFARGYQRTDISYLGDILELIERKWKARKYN